MNETLIQVRQTSRRNNVFNLIREKNEQLSRFDICKITKYSTTTIKTIVDDMIEEGLVFEGESKDTRVGRRPSILSINKEAIYFAGIECSSAAINFTVINAGQEIVHHTTLPLSNPMTEEILLSMEGVLDEFSEQNKEIWSLVPTISFSLPGKIDCEQGIGIQYGSVPGWKNIDFKQRFEKYRKKMCFAHNVDSMLNGYRIQHNITPEKSILFIVIRNSVGARFFSNGVLLSKFGVISEVAHIRANGSNRRCSCGKKGCYDTEISVRAIKNKLREACNAGLLDRRAIDPDGTGIDINSFLDLAAGGDEVAFDIFSEIIDYISEMMEMLLSFFRPDIVVFSSFLCTRPHLFKELLDKRLARCYSFSELPDFEYLSSANELGAFGVAVTGYDECFSVNPLEV